MRNLQKTIDSANVSNFYDLTYGELQEFTKRVNENCFLGIRDLFAFGYAVGQRALKRELERQSKAEEEVK